MISSTANARNLFIHYDLYKGQTSCIQLEYLAVNSLISVECVEDYNIYIDDYKFCSGEIVLIRFLFQRKIIYGI